MSNPPPACERCGRALEPGEAYTVGLRYPEGGRVSLRVCADCGNASRRFLFGPVEPPSAEPGPEHEEAVSVPARAGWFVFRMGAYGLLALGAFALATWLSVR